jgi:carbamoylphosphate synthase large subunit
VQFGGQTPLNLAHGLEKAGVPIIGTSVDSIDLAEDRERFQQAAAATRSQVSLTTASPTRSSRPDRNCRSHRLPRAGSPQLRARRTRHGDLL